MPLKFLVSAGGLSPHAAKGSYRGQCERRQRRHIHLRPEIPFPSGGTLDPLP